MPSASNFVQLERHLQRGLLFAICLMELKATTRRSTSTFEHKYSRGSHCSSARDLDERHLPVQFGTGARQAGHPFELEWAPLV